MHKAFWLFSTPSSHVSFPLLFALNSMQGLLLHSCPLVSFCEPLSLTRTICLTIVWNCPVESAGLTWATQLKTVISPPQEPGSSVQLREAGLCECLPSPCLTDDSPFPVLAQCRQPQLLCFHGCNGCHAKEPAFHSPALSLSHCQSIRHRGTSFSSLSILSLLPILCVVLETELRATHMLDKHFITELDP